MPFTFSVSVLISMQHNSSLLHQKIMDFIPKTTATYKVIKCFYAHLKFILTVDGSHVFLFSVYTTSVSPVSFARCLNNVYNSHQIFIYEFNMHSLKL